MPSFWPNIALRALPADPVEIRGYVLDVFDAAFEFDYSMAFGVGCRGEDHYVSWGLVPHKVRSPDVHAYWSSFFGNPLPAGAVHWRPTLEGADPPNAFVTLHQVDLTKRSAYQQLYGRFGLVDQIRALIFDGPRFVCWFGGVSRTPIDELTAGRVRALYPAIQRAMVQADRLERP